MDSNIADSNIMDSNKESEGDTSNLLPSTFTSEDVGPVEVDKQVTRGLIVLFVTALGISVAVDSTISNEEYDSWMIFMHAPRIIYAIFINTLLVYFIIKKDTWRRLGYVSWFCSNNNAHIELDNFVGDGNQRQTSVETKDVTVPSDESSMLITLYTFGFGSCVFRCLEIASDVHCMAIGFTKSVPLEWVVILDHFTSLIASFLQLLFFRMYSRALFANRVFFHFSLSALVGLQAWWWFGKLISPLISIYDVDDVDLNCSTSNTRMSFKKCCANHSDFVYGIDEVQYYLKGLYTEYAVVSLGVLVQLWPSSHHAETQNSTSRARRSLSDQKSALLDRGRSNDDFGGSRAYQESSFVLETTAEQFDKICGNYGSTAVTHSKVTKYTLFEKYYSIIWCFVYLIPFLSLLKLVFSDHYMREKLLTKDASENLQYYSLIPTFVILPVVIVMTRKRLRPRVGFRNDHLGIVDYVLLITVCPIFLISFFRIWASLGFLFTSDSKSNILTLAFAIVFAVTNIVEAWLQTEFLINIQRFEVTSQFRPFVRKALMYILIANVLLWLVDNLINEWNSVIFVPIIDGWYGNHSLLIMAVVFPANSLFRFQSAEVAYHAWKRLGKGIKAR